MFTLKQLAENLCIQMLGRSLSPQEIEACDYVTLQPGQHYPLVFHDEESEQLRIGFAEKKK